MMHKYFSLSQYLVKVIECVSKEEAQPIPRNLLGYLPSRFRNEDFNYIIMPKLGNNTLLDFLMRIIHHNSLPEVEYRASIKLSGYICRKVFDAFFHLHTVEGVAHGENKPDNIMFTDAKGLALIDFGQAEKLGTVLNHKIGSPSYQAPEVLLNKPNYVIDQADIYDLGCTLFTVLFLDFPFGEKFSKNEFY
jgi:serine/threonine protein kinase